MPRLKTGVSLNTADQARFNKTLKRLSVFAKTEVATAMKDEANKTEKRMRKDAPVDTGRLKTNIKVTKTAKAVEFESEALNSSGKDYAWRQEFGVGAPRREYFFPNLRKYRRNLTKRLRNILRKRTK